jgi:hypothetical protein
MITALPACTNNSSIDEMKQVIHKLSIMLTMHQRKQHKLVQDHIHK